MAALRDLADPCRLCPRRCGAHRLRGEVGTCGLGERVRLARACHHRGEEPPLSGTEGAGTLFFAGCNLQCRYCQNHQISGPDGAAAAARVPPPALAEQMLALQARGCHNVELVTATPVLPAVVEAIALARSRGLAVPVVHNSSAYESVEVLSLLEGVVDVYLPDLKYGEAQPARRWSNAPDYVEVSQAAVREMARQVGPLQVDDDGLALRGLLVRHLVLPGDQSGTERVLAFIARALPRSTPVSLMAQYRPPPGIALPPPLDRPVRPEEYEAAQRALEVHGLTEGWVQQLDSVESYVPDFTDPAHPFER